MGHRLIQANIGAMAKNKKNKQMMHARQIQILLLHAIFAVSSINQDLKWNVDIEHFWVLGHFTFEPGPNVSRWNLNIAAQT